MRPLLPPGARVGAVPIRASTRLREGDIVLAQQGGVAMVKRIGRVLPDERYLLIGDNPGRSTDSRHFGPVGRHQIMARARWRYWPFPPRRLG